MLTFVSGLKWIPPSHHSEPVSCLRVKEQSWYHICFKILDVWFELHWSNGFRSQNFPYWFFSQRKNTIVDVWQSFVSLDFVYYLNFFSLEYFGTFRVKSFEDILNCTLIVLKQVKFCLFWCRKKQFTSKKLVTLCDTTRHHISQESDFQKTFSMYISRHVKHIGVFVQVMKASTLKFVEAHSCH